MKWKHSETEREGEGERGRGNNVLLALKLCRWWRDTVEGERKERGLESRKIGRERKGEILICRFLVR